VNSRMAVKLAVAMVAMTITSVTPARTSDEHHRKQHGSTTIPVTPVTTIDPSSNCVVNGVVNSVPTFDSAPAPPSREHHRKGPKSSPTVLAFDSGPSIGPRVGEPRVGEHHRKGPKASQLVPATTPSAAAPCPPGGDGTVVISDPFDGNSNDNSGNTDNTGLNGGPLVPTNPPTIVTIPEPGTLALLALGLGSLWLGRRRK
jgi:PEP-CTERM motif